ncbi:MAG: NosR/NirI family protein [Magnetospirillum sp.]|nr:NosR/NirI family protein [Magnetospirillum sp.]
MSTSPVPAPAHEIGAWRDDVKPADVFPGADRFGPPEGTPEAQAAFKGDTLLGYVFETSDIGYSGKPIKVMAGMDNTGKIVGARVTEHHEPILLAGIPNEKLTDFVAKYVGKSVLAVTADGAPRPAVDVVAGATVTAIVIDDGLLRTALKVARSRGLAGFQASTGSGRDRLAAKPFAPLPFQDLLGQGMVRRLSLSNAEVDAAFAKIGVGAGEAYGAPADPAAEFIDLNIALVSPELIGRNLLGDAEYKALQDWLQPGQSAIVVAGQGAYSWRGSGYVRGGIFDRIQLIQDGMSVRFSDKLYRRIGRLQSDAPDFPEIGLFKIPEDMGFDPARPWRLELLAQRATSTRQKAFTSFALEYSLPPAMIERAPEPAKAATPASASATAEDSGRTALWQGIWKTRAVDIAILSVSLAILTLIFFFQDVLVKHPKLFVRLRMGFLAFTVLWIGAYAGAQLSVVNVFTFVQALMTGFRWDFFLLEPLIFILWCATAVSLLFWGRGAYCGWLCPFGALQEILNAIAKKLGVRQFTPKFAWHERFWALKYVIFIALLGLSLYSLALAERWAEVEPFKTVWLVHFARDWVWVAYALLMLAAGLFVERFYCRYLCPLGGALGIPGRMRLFEWLKRRKQCGFECQKCAKECMVQAIHPNGQINPNECLYCMHCQVVYQDHGKCTPLLLKAQARKKAQAQAQQAQAQPDTQPAV